MIGSPAGSGKTTLLRCLAGIERIDSGSLSIGPRVVADGRTHLSGRIADVAFRGRGRGYAIDIPGLGRLTGVFARHRAERGDQVGMRLDPAGGHLFPAGDTVPSVTPGERAPSPYIEVQ